MLYLLPLAGAFDLIVNPKGIILSVTAVIMLLTQPVFDSREARDKSATDRNSVYLILILGLLNQIVPVIEWGYFGTGANGTESAITCPIGLAMMLGELALRIWSIRTLGKFFTAPVQIVEGHRVIKHGPFAIVRHPSYLGAFVAIIGGAVFLNAPVGTVTASVLMAIAYKKRLASEETTLLKEFGDDYLEYSRSTAKIIPFVW